MGQLVLTRDRGQSIDIRIGADARLLELSKDIMDLLQAVQRHTHNNFPVDVEVVSADMIQRLLKNLESLCETTITVTLVDVNKGKGRIGFTCPRSIPVWRTELNAPKESV